MLILRPPDSQVYVLLYAYTRNKLRYIMSVQREKERERERWLYGGGRSTVGDVHSALYDVEIFVEISDARLDVSLQLTATEMRETHHLQVADDGVNCHLRTHTHIHTLTLTPATLF